MTKFPENKREMVSEYINRVNYGTILGNFEIDMNDGEVHYKTSVNYEHVNLTSESFQKSVGALIGMNHQMYVTHVEDFETMLTNADISAKELAELIDERIPKLA